MLAMVKVAMTKYEFRVWSNKKNAEDLAELKENLFKRRGFISQQTYIHCVYCFIEYYH